ncbi:tectonic [Choristoneura fumiferana]|uniref:tectonic n=1 Tax=Choristoneura fumiferana TaxID=7141 RepID=UPI003D154707
MKIITYLGFTLVSILVQFCVMDFIQERLQVEEKPIIFNVSSQRKQFRDILKEYTNKPHALYYRTSLNRLTDYKNISTTPAIYRNTSLLDSSTSTESYSTSFEMLYDESGSVLDTDTTTESFYTSTEIDNVTDFVLFETRNKTKEEPNAILPKRTLNKKKCDCNFLYKVCDINCCCDVDCSDADIKLFLSCTEKVSHTQQDVCYPQLDGKTQPSSVNNFLCIAKMNLPEKRNINKNKYDPEFVTRTRETTLKWQNKALLKNNKEFTNKRYTYGDPIWLLRNNSITYLEVSSPVVNNYCTGRKRVQFLKEENIVCSVKLTHLEMIQILNTIEESCIISVIDRSFNASILDCSTLHCTNWSVIVCEDTSCVVYNKSMHEPFCTDSKCTFIALKMDYIFYYHNFKIVNATVKLYTQNVSMMLPFMTQELGVKFYLANASTEHAIRFSGVPGYVHGLPVIASFVEANHTDAFFKNTPLKKHLALPINENGNCVKSPIKENTLLFGLNKRTKCRLSFEPSIISNNGTNTCKLISKYINEYLELNNTIFVSPTGNPLGRNDEDWLPVHIKNIDKESIHGEFFHGTLSLTCYNIATKIFFIFTYADKSNIDFQIQNEILSADVEVMMQNVTFNMDDFSTVLTIDITFIDVTKPPQYEFAGSPDLNIHLPRDFFFPFSSQASVKDSNSTLIALLCLFVVCSVCQNKIP